jgi:hypothetical protein
MDGAHRDTAQVIMSHTASRCLLCFRSAAARIQSEHCASTPTTKHTQGPHLGGSCVCLAFQKFEGPTTCVAVNAGEPEQIFAKSVLCEVRVCCVCPDCELLLLGCCSGAQDLIFLDSSACAALSALSQQTSVTTTTTDTMAGKGKGGRGADAKKSTSKSSKAGLQFPVARLGRYLKKGRYAQRVGAG